MLWNLISIGVVSVIVVEAQEDNPRPQWQPTDGNTLNAPRGAPLFGTINGYDVGGDDAVCWVSLFSVFDDDSTGMSNSTGISTGGSSLEILNERLFADETDQVYLLPSCPDKTQMTLTPVQDLNKTLDGLFDIQMMHTDRTYEFHLQVQIDLYSFLKVNSTLRQRVEEAGILKCHARLRLCDALNQGFCNPLTDTTERDRNLTLRSQTDQTSAKTELLPQDDSKWNYSEDTTLLGIWGDDTGKIIDSRWIQLDLKEVNEDEDLFSAQVNASFRLPTANIRPGTYLMLGHAVLYFELDDKNVQRLDVAHSIPNHVVEVFPPPKILTVTRSAKIWLGVAIGVLGSFALCFLLFIVKHRTHDVMKLAQGSFLAAMAATCLVQTAFSFTFLPSRDALETDPENFTGALPMLYQEDVHGGFASTGCTEHLSCAQC